MYVEADKSICSLVCYVTTDKYCITSLMEKDEPSTFNIDLLTGDITTIAPMVSFSKASQSTSRLLDTPKQMLPPDSPPISKIFPGKIKSPRKAREMPEKNSLEYIHRRQRNNVAVKKSREKTRERSRYTLQKVEQLKVENEQLESKISTLTKELSVLKDLFMDHARGFCAGGSLNLLSVDQLEKILGCKVLKNEPQPSTSGAADEVMKDTVTSQPVSNIEPLINVAEKELNSIKQNETSSDSSTKPMSVVKKEF